MKILYYCPEYYSKRGGRTHARGFFGALKEVSTVSEYHLYPKSDPNAPSTGTRTRPYKDRFRFIPHVLRRVYFYFKPKRELTKALKAELKAHGCDALVIRTGTKLPMIDNIKREFPGLRVCLELNSAHFDESFPNLPFRSIFQAWEVKRLKPADAFVVVSTYLKNYLEKRGVRPEKILVNPNGVNAKEIGRNKSADIRRRYGISTNAFVIGYVGGMERFRRLPEVVGYIGELCRQGTNDLVFMVVGDGTDMPVVNAAIEADNDTLGSVVKLTGWLEHAEVTDMLAMFDIAIFPFTNAYCSPLKLFEYLGAGVPTIGPDTPAVTEVFQKDKHLMLVKQDGSDFKEAIIKLKEDPGLRSRLAENGRQFVLSEYTWKKNAERVVSHIQDVS